MSFVSQNPEQLESEIEQTKKLMLQNERSRSYIEAQFCKLKLQQCERELTSVQSEDLLIKHQNEISQLNEHFKNQENKLFNKWKKQKKQFLQIQRQKDFELKKKFKEEEQKLIKSLQLQIPLTCIQTLPLVNMRKILYHLVKQKQFDEASKVQTIVNKEAKVQQTAWEKIRQDKIKQALVKLRLTHSKQLQLYEYQQKIQNQNFSFKQFQQHNKLLQQWKNQQKIKNSQQIKERNSFYKLFTTKGGELKS